MIYVLLHAACGATLFLVFWFSGRRLSASLRPAVAELGAPAVFETALGMVVWMAALFTLAAVGALSTPLLRIGFFGVLALAVLQLVRTGFDWRRVCDTVRGQAVSAAPVAHVALLFCAFVLLIFYVRSLLPSVGWDDNSYHLTLPRLFLESHGFRHVPFSLYATWPLATELLYALAMAVQDFVLAKSVAFGCAVLLCCALYSFTRREAGPGAGALALVLLLMNQPVLSSLDNAYVDTANALFLFLASWAWLAANAAGVASATRNRLLLLTSIFLGFFAGSKLTGVVVIPCFALMQLVVGLIERRPLRSVGLCVLLVAVPAFALALPWYVKSWLSTGDPLHPGLYAIFSGGGDEWSAELAEATLRYHASLGMGRSLGDYLLLPVRLLSSQSDEFRGHFNVVWGLLLPPGIWGALGSQFARRALGIAGLYFVYWSLSSQQARLLIPVLPLVSAATAIGLYRLVGEVLGARGPAVTRAAALVASALLLADVAWSHGPRLPGVLRRFAVPAGAVLASAVPEHFRFVNEQLAPDATLMFLNTNQGFFCEREYIADSLFEGSQMNFVLRQTSDAASLAALFQRLGVTHVLRDRNLEWGIAYPAHFLLELERGRLLRRIYDAGRIEIYEVAPYGATSPGRWDPPAGVGESLPSGDRSPAGGALCSTTGSAIDTAPQQAVEGADGGARVVFDEDAVNAQGDGGVDVGVVVVEEDGPFRGDAAEALQCEPIDRRIGLAKADLAGVDHELEELLHRQHRSPMLAELGDVVGEQGGAVAVAPKPADALDELAARTAAFAEAEQHPQRIEFETLAGALGHDLLLGGGEGDFAALEPVPGVVGVLVVGAEHDRLHLARLGAELYGGVAHRAERRRREDSAEVEDHYVDRSRHWNLPVAELGSDSARSQADRISRRWGRRPKCPVPGCWSVRIFGIRGV